MTMLFRDSRFADRVAEYCCKTSDSEVSFWPTDHVDSEENFDKTFMV